MKKLRNSGFHDFLKHEVYISCSKMIKRLITQHLISLRLPPGWNVGEGSDLQGDLRLVGCAAAPGSRHPGAGFLLGLHEGQPAPSELHIEPFPTIRILDPTRQARRKDGFKEKQKHKKQNIYLHPNPERKKFSSSSSCSFPF